MFSPSSRHSSALQQLLTLYRNGYDGSGEETSDGSGLEDSMEHTTMTTVLSKDPAHSNGLTQGLPVPRVKFRWHRTEICSDPFVLLSAPFSDEPVLLSWNASKEVYETPSLAVPCGPHSCALHVGRDTFWLDTFYVGPHTFEVSLYIAEEDATEETQSPIPTTEDETDFTSQSDSEILSKEGATDGGIVIDSGDFIIDGATNILLDKEFQTSTEEVDEESEEVAPTSDKSPHDRENSEAKTVETVDVKTMEGDAVLRHSTNYLKLVRAQLATSDPDWKDTVDSGLQESPGSKHAAPKVDRNANLQNGQSRSSNREFHDVNFQPIRNGVERLTEGRSGSDAGSGLHSNSSEQELSRYFDGRGTNGRCSADQILQLQSEGRNGDRWPSNHDHYADSQRSRSLGNTPPTGRRRLDFSDEQQNGADLTNRDRRSVDQGQNSDQEHDRLSDSAGRQSSLSSLDRYSAHPWQDPSSQIPASYSDQFLDKDRLSDRSVGRNRHAENDIHSSLPARSGSLDRHLSRASGGTQHDLLSSGLTHSERLNVNPPVGVHRAGSGDVDALDLRSNHSRYQQRQSSSSEMQTRQEQFRDPAEPRHSSPKLLHSIPPANQRQRDTIFDGYDRSHAVQPQLRPPLVTSRTTPLSSHGSSRTTAPLVPNSGSKPIAKTDAYRVQDLEDTVISLKRVLTEREKEVDELRSHQQSMEAELRQLKVSRERGPEDKQKMDDYVHEREKLLTEIQQLREEVHWSRPSSRASSRSESQGASDYRSRGHIDGHNRTSHPPLSGSLENYDPNNPSVLQRKIRDMESQLADLHEAQETSAAQLQRTERHLQAIKEENHRLKLSDATVAEIAALKEENMVLRKQLQKREGSLPQEEGADYLQLEVHQLRDHLRGQRDDNHQLMEENIRLKEHIRDLENQTMVKQENNHNRDSNLRYADRIDSTNVGDLEGDIPGESHSHDRHGVADHYHRDWDHALNEAGSAKEKIRFSQQSKGEYSHFHDQQDLDGGRRGGTEYSPDRPREVHLRDTDRVEEFLLSGDEDNDEDEFFLIKGNVYPNLSSAPPITTGPLSTPKRPLVNGNLSNLRSGHYISGHLAEERQTSYHSASSPSSRRLLGNREQTSPASLSSSKRKDWTSPSENGTEKLTSQEVVEDVFDEPPHQPTSGQSNNAVENKPPGDDLNNNQSESVKKNTVEEVLARLGIKEKPLDDGSDKISATAKIVSNGDTVTKNKSAAIVGVCNKVNLQNGEQITSSGEEASISGHIIVTGTAKTDEKQAVVDCNNTSDQLNEQSVLPNSCASIDKSLKDNPSQGPIHQERHESVQCIKDRNGRSEVKATPNNPGGADFCKQISGSNDLKLCDLSAAGSHDIPPPSLPVGDLGGDDFVDLRMLGNLDSNRRDSFGSDCTDFILDEAEKTINLSNSGLLLEDLGDVEGRAISPLPVSSGSPSPVASPVPGSWTSGSRSFSSKPIITQHNKGSLSSNHSNSNKRPFAPRSASDIIVGDVVKFSRQGGKISKGLVKYAGHLPGKHDTYLGVELEHEIGKHDGIYENHRYFQCQPNRGVFVAFSKVVMIWGSH